MSREDWGWWISCTLRTSGRGRRQIQRRREMLRGVRSVRTGRISRGINIPRGRGGRGGEERTVVVETLDLGLEWQKRGCGETGDTAK
jgi:hypothetical protein